MARPSGRAVRNRHRHAIAGRVSIAPISLHTLGQWHATFCDMEVVSLRLRADRGLRLDVADAAPTTVAPTVSPKPTMDLDLPLALAIDGTKTPLYDAPLWTN